MIKLTKKDLKKEIALLQNYRSRLNLEIHQKKVV